MIISCYYCKIDAFSSCCLLLFIEISPYDTEDRFRKAVSNSKGMKKGNISIAIDLWIEEQKHKERNGQKR